MNRLALFLVLRVLVLIPAASCPAAPSAPSDLGRNLTYLRIHRLPDDAPALAAAWSRPALIIDLRYPAGDGGNPLAAALAVRPAAMPLFVLVGPATPVVALAELRARAPALITLGLPAPGLTPDIALAVRPEDDRQAYEALESGASIESLIDEKSSGPRFDEAALVHERARGSDPEDAAGTHAVTPPEARPPAGSAAAAPDVHPAPAAPAREPRDLVLERAVQLHRALLALGKLPRG